MHNKPDQRTPSLYWTILLVPMLSALERGGNGMAWVRQWLPTHMYTLLQRYTVEPLLEDTPHPSIMDTY